MSLRHDVRDDGYALEQLFVSVKGVPCE